MLTLTADYKIKQLIFISLFTAALFSGCGEKKQNPESDEKVKNERQKLITAQQQMLEWIKTDEAFEIILTSVEKPSSINADSLINRKIVEIIINCGIEDEKKCEKLYKKFRNDKEVKKLQRQFEMTMNSILDSAVQRSGM